MINEDLLYIIFQYLTIKQIENCRRVSKGWKEVVDKRWLWEQKSKQVKQKIIDIEKGVKETLMNYQKVVSTIRYNNVRNITNYINPHRLIADIQVGLALVMLEEEREEKRLMEDENRALGILRGLGTKEIISKIRSYPMEKLMKRKRTKKRLKLIVTRAGFTNTNPAWTSFSAVIVAQWLIALEKQMETPKSYQKWYCEYRVQQKQEQTIHRKIEMIKDKDKQHQKKIRIKKELAKKREFLKFKYAAKKKTNTSSHHK